MKKRHAKRLPEKERLKIAERGVRGYLSTLWLALKGHSFDREYDD